MKYGGTLRGFTDYEDTEYFFEIDPDGLTEALEGLMRIFDGERTFAEKTLDSALKALDAEHDYHKGDSNWYELLTT